MTRLRASTFFLCFCLPTFKSLYGKVALLEIRGKPICIFIFSCDLMVLENRRSKYVDCCSAAAAFCNGLSDEIHLDTDCN